MKAHLSNIDYNLCAMPSMKETERQALSKTEGRRGDDKMGKGLGHTGCTFLHPIPSYNIFSVIKNYNSDNSC